jgi:hypothetical protein
MEYRGLVISLTDDCEENTGGYFCEVHQPDVLDDRIDYFCIHPDELSENPDIEFWIRNYIDDTYQEYARDGLVPPEVIQQSM